MYTTFGVVCNDKNWIMEIHDNKICQWNDTSVMYYSFYTKYEYVRQRGRSRELRKHI